MNGAATNPDFDVVARAAVQIKNAIDATIELGGENYVFWGGKAGNGSCGVVPVDRADVRHHQNADVNKRCGAGVGRNELRDRCEAHRDEEQRGGCHRGKTRCV